MRNKFGVYPGVETRVTLAPVDTVDPDHILQDLGVDGWRRPRRERRVVWWFLREGAVNRATVVRCAAIAL